MSAASDDWSLYPYKPNQAAPIFFAVFLTLLCVVQVYQSFFQYRWWRFGIAQTWAGVVWVAGFVCRSISVRETQSVGIYIAQYVLIFVGPPFFAASEYFILGRLFAYLPYHAPIHPSRVFGVFALLSAAVEALAANGAARSASPTPSQVGQDLIKASLILQCFIEVAFMSLVAFIQYRCRKAGCFPRGVKIVSYTLYVTSSMMLLRCIIRVIGDFEAASCDSTAPDMICGVVNRNEAFLYVFEVANITVFIIFLCIFHPGRYLPRSAKVYLDPYDQRLERKGPGFGGTGKRSWFGSSRSPLLIMSLFNRDKMVIDKFWERHQPIYYRTEGPREAQMESSTDLDTQAKSDVERAQ